MTKKYISLEHAIRNAVRDQQYTKKPLNEDFEFEMARNELRTAIDAAKRLMTHLDGEGELEAWVQSKITKGADYLDTVADYMDSRDTKKLKEETEELMEALGIVGGVFKGNQFQGGVPEIGPGHTKAALRTSSNRKAVKQQKSLTIRGKVMEENELNEDSTEDYYNKMYALAKKHGSPDPHVTASVAALESNWGRSRMAREGHNHFGQTVRSGQPGMIGADGQSHKVYDTDDDAVKHHIERWGKHYTSDGAKTIDNLRKNGYNTVNRGDPWVGAVGAIHAKRKDRNMPDVDTDTVQTAKNEPTPKIKQVSTTPPKLPDIITKGSDSDSDSPKLYMGGKVVPFSPSRGTVSPAMAYADTGAPKAPKEPEEPKEPKTVSSAASNGDQSAGEYWNQEAARNKAAGGAPLPNEFNIFGDKPKKSLKETILEVRRDSLIKEEDKKKDDDEEDDNPIIGFVKKIGRDIGKSITNIPSNLKGAKAYATGAGYQTAKDITGREEPVDPEEIEKQTKAGLDIGSKLSGGRAPASKDSEKKATETSKAFEKEIKSDKKLKAEKPEEFAGGEAASRTVQNLAAVKGIYNLAKEVPATFRAIRAPKVPKVPELPKPVSDKTKVETPEAPKPVEAKAKVETPEVTTSSPPKLNVPDQVTAKPTSKNIMSFRKFTRKTEAPAAANDTSLPGAKATEVPDAFKAKGAPAAANDVTPKIETPKAPKAPEEAPMPKKGGKKPEADDGVEQLNPRSQIKPKAEKLPPEESKVPEKKDLKPANDEVTPIKPPKEPETVNPGNVGKEKISKPETFQDNAPGKKDIVPQGTPAPKEKGKYRPGVKVTKSNPNTLPNNDNATVAPKVTAPAPSVAPAPAKAPVASPAPSVAPAPAKAPAPSVAPRLAPAPEAVPEPAPKIAPRPRPEAVPRPRPEPIKKAAEKPTGPKKPIIPPFFGGGSDDQYNWNKNHTNPWLAHRAQKRIQNEETGPDNTRRKDSSKELVGRPNSAGVKDPKSVLGRNASIVSKIIEEKKLAGIVKTIVKKKKEEKEGGPNPLVDFEPKLNHKYDNES